jgi:hypothetical protein
VVCFTKEPFGREVSMSSVLITSSKIHYIGLATDEYHDYKMKFYNLYIGMHGKRIIAMSIRDKPNFFNDTRHPKQAVLWYASKKE